MLESELSEKFVGHLQSGNVGEFINELSSLMKNDLRNELLWLFLGRGYEAVGDIERARNCYTSLKRLCRSSDKFEDEITTFFADYGQVKSEIDVIGLTCVTAQLEID